MMPILKGQPISNRLSKGLEILLKEGIVAKSQCLFFRRFYVSNPHITVDLFDDMTAYECLLSIISTLKTFVLKMSCQMLYLL